MHERVEVLWFCLTFPLYHSFWEFVTAWLVNSSLSIMLKKKFVPRMVFHLIGQMMFKYDIPDYIADDIQDDSKNYKNFHVMLMMMVENCFCVIVDWRKVFSLISCRDHCQRCSPVQISHTLPVGFEPAPNLTLGLVEWSCAVVATNTPRCQ